MFEPCPCGHGKTYLNCCARLHTGRAEAETPEELMRARYSAFVRADPAFLLASWSPETRPARLDRLEPREWSGLSVEAEETLGPDRATVTFTARYREDGVERRLREKSLFRRERGRWVYVDGEIF